MLQALPPRDFLNDDAPIIDVRSPGEFHRAHIPGAVPFPLFSDEERAVVGTIYKQQGRDAAVLEGLRSVGPRLAGYVEKAMEIAPQGRIRVHCWRGGERSGSMAWLLTKAGFKEVITLRGGYKAFRQLVLQHFQQPVALHVLGGFTGSGKTLLLDRIRANGEQVIDLEALARHRGSSFGALGMGPQPTTEHFENLLYDRLQAMDPARSIWVEDESLMIGRVRIPDRFFFQMRNAPMLFIEMPLEQRAERLVQEYGGHSKEELAAAITRIARRLGPQHAKSALEALEQDDLLTVATITLRYYDKAYLRGSSDRDPGNVYRMPLNAGQLSEFTERSKEYVNLWNHRSHKTDPV